MRIRELRQVLTFECNPYSRIRRIETADRWDRNAGCNSGTRC